MTGNVALVASITVAGALVGFAIWRRVSSLAYRQDNESSQPSPGPRWWIPVATAAASGLLAWRLGSERWPLLLPTLPLAWFGPWLSAIDLEVRRLPNRLLAAHAAAVAVGTVAASIAADDAAIVTRAALGACVAFGVFWLLDRLRPGGFGWGDGKYVPILGAATAAVSLAATWWGFVIGCTAAVAATPFRRGKTDFPFGPWLATGALVSPVLFG